MEGQRGARPCNVETTGARVSFHHRNIFPENYPPEQYSHTKRKTAFFLFSLLTKY